MPIIIGLTSICVFVPMVFLQAHRELTNFIRSSA
jgi:hypothetical protein